MGGPRRLRKRRDQGQVYGSGLGLGLGLGCDFGSRKPCFGYLRDGPHAVSCVSCGSREFNCDEKMCLQESARSSSVASKRTSFVS